MQALVEAGLPVAAVISNRADADGLEFARSRKIATAVVEHAAFANRDAFDSALARESDRVKPRPVALGGFIPVLTPGFVRPYRDRLRNLQPAPFPAVPGPHPPDRAPQARV